MLMKLTGTRDKRQTVRGGNTTPTILPRDDARCGTDYGGVVCDLNGAYGGCCSASGFCGSTSMHCLISNGCQSGCLNMVASAMQEPQILPASSMMDLAAQPTALLTVDGTCGLGNNATLCGSWPHGNCCSMYGFCGNTSAHCDAGCQSGACANSSAEPAPGPRTAPQASHSGRFEVIGSSGVPAMHAALLPNGRVVFLDKLENYTELTLSNGHYAMSSEYNPADNTVVPLAYSSNAFCSGGAFLANGSLINLGGNGPLTWLDPTIGDGFNAVRYLHRAGTSTELDGQDWVEPGNKLSSNRWYASAQTLPDGTIFVASGSLNGLDPTLQMNNNPTYEILDTNGVSRGQNIPLEILEKNQPYYMYPFMHLLSDGSLFIFVSKSSVRFSVEQDAVIKSYPDLLGDFRTYPNTGGSVLLPLSSSNDWNPDVLICGGGAYQDISSPTDPTCGRISPLSEDPVWEMDSMPEGRGMVEGTLLPDGTIIWLNGGGRGAQGFGLMAEPTLEALHYDPSLPLGQRFTTLASSQIPRLYHSVALLLLDGTMMIAGSNPVQMPVLLADADNPYITEFRVELYTPPYLQDGNEARRPTDVTLSLTAFEPSTQFSIDFEIPSGIKAVAVVLYHGGFVTHSLHMGHRMLYCNFVGWVAGATKQSLFVTAPPNHNILPPGPYVIYLVADGVPSVGQVVTVQ